MYEAGEDVQVQMQECWRAGAAAVSRSSSCAEGLEGSFMPHPHNMTATIDEGEDALHDTNHVRP